MMATPPSRLIVDLDAREHHEMAERDELARALGGLDAGDARRREDVALRRVAGDEAHERVVAHAHAGARDARGAR